jgi:hypothetical protein
MKTFSLVLLSLLIGLSISDRSLAEVYTTGSAADNNNNIIVIGYCLGNVRIAGLEYTITQPSAFILKLDSDGEMIWVKFINSNQSIKANAVAVDDNGNIYVTGEFSGTANFGAYLLTSQGIDAFIVKLDSTGNVEWVKHGKSTGTARGNDIYIDDDAIIYVCGSGTLVSFDSLSTSGGGFTLKIGPQGNIVLLFNSLDNSYQITLDVENNIIVCGGQWSHVYSYYLPQLGKFTNQGNLIWKYHGVAPSNVSTKFFPATDSNLNIYTALQHGNKTFLSKSDPNGTTLTPLFGYMNLGTTDWIFNNQDYFYLCGAYLSNLQFGDTTFITNGAEDAYFAKIDTGFNPIWIKRGGGNYKDELTSISLLNDGSIISTGNFRGAIQFENFNYSGGTGIDDQWSALIKSDDAGNLLWFKKIGENYMATDTINWLPMYAGNKWHFLGKKHYSSPSNLTERFLHNITAVDSSIVNNKKYYLLNGFFGFLSGTIFRFDEESQKIYAMVSNIEYTFMDFSKSSGESFQQIQPDGSLYPVNVITSNYPVLYDTLLVKGFYKSKDGINGWYYFAPDIGLVFQDEEVVSQFISEVDLYIIEYYMNYPFPNIVHVKHNNTPNIQFELVTHISDTNRIIQQFEIVHPYSFKTVPPYLNGFSYIKNSYLQSFYYNGADTVWNNFFNIPQTTEIDFCLNYQFDTTKYNQGYHLYYRIAAVDKGIVPDTFYAPQSGFYKLFWKDSTTSVSPVDFLPSEYSLFQNFPNPFNPSSIIVFTIPERNFVSLKVFDLLGSEIISLVNEELDAGRYEVEFSGNDFSSGVYIYQIRAGSFIDTKKMILLR